MLTHYLGFRMHVHNDGILRAISLVAAAMVMMAYNRNYDYLYDTMNSKVSVPQYLLLKIIN